MSTSNVKQMIPKVWTLQKTMFDFRDSQKNILWRILFAKKVAKTVLVICTEVLLAPTPLFLKP